MKKFFLVLFVFVSGCTTYPNNTEDPVKYSLGIADQSLAVGDCRSAERNMTNALLAINGASSLSTYLKGNADALECFLSLQQELILQVDSPSKANDLHNKFRALQQVEQISNSLVVDLLEKLDHQVLSGNKSGKISFSLSDSIANFPSLNNDEHQVLLAKRTIELMSAGETEIRPIRNIVKFVNIVGAESKEGRELLSQLEMINLNPREVSMLREVYPDLQKLSNEEHMWPDSFSRRDFKLGITLDHFKNIRHPDEESWPNAFPVCSNESRASLDNFRSNLSISENLSKAGVVKCKHFYRSRSVNQVYPAGLMLSDISSRTEFYFIRANDNDQYRLYYIRSTGPSDSYSGLYLVLDSAFGRPASSQDELLSNAMGAQFVNHKHIWRTPSSRIELNKYSESIRRLEVKFILDPLWDIYMKRLEENISEKANRI